MKKNTTISLMFVILVVSLIIALKTIVTIPVELQNVSIVIMGYVIILLVPFLFINGIANYLKKEQSSLDCGGLKSGGLLIGFSERTLIYMAFLIAYVDGGFSYTSIMSFLSIIVAGKAIFRYSRGTTPTDNSTIIKDDRACADWHIIGTFLSMGWGLFIAWIVFRFLMVG